MVQRERDRQGAAVQEDLYMPSPTFAPIILAFGVTLLTFGTLYRVITPGVWRLR